jgi:predicted branched-subunit amino acid permease
MTPSSDTDEPHGEPGGIVATAQRRTIFTRRGIVSGATQSLVLAPSVFAFGCAFGIMAAASGLTLAEAMLMSAWVNAGSAQMAVLQIWAEPIPLATLCLTVLAMNARYVLLGAALHPWLAHLPPHQTYPSLYVLGDGNWALALRAFSTDRADAGFLLGSGLVMFATWQISTTAGHLFGQVLGDPKRFGIDFMVAAFFACMAVAFFRSARGVAPLIIAVVVSIVVERLIPGPWYIFAGALAGSLAGAWRHGAAA